MEQAQQIEELKLLYGDKWANIYKEILTKQRLETVLLTKEDTNITYTSNNNSYSTCNSTSNSTNTKY